MKMTNGPFLYVRRAEKRLFYLKKDPRFREGFKGDAGTESGMTLLLSLRTLDFRFRSSPSFG
jgi:hypothetical protein